jgi:hypothetical protein
VSTDVNARAERLKIVRQPARTARSLAGGLERFQIGDDLTRRLSKAREYFFFLLWSVVVDVLVRARSNVDSFQADLAMFNSIRLRDPRVMDPPMRRPVT